MMESRPASEVVFISSAFDCFLENLLKSNMIKSMVSMVSSPRITLFLTMYF